MIASMAPVSTLAAGSAGSVETQYLDLPDPVRLDCGRELHPVRVAYETYGTLSPSRDNVVLVCHALSGDAHAAGFAKTPPAESTRDGFGATDRDGSAGKGLGWWDGMIGPGKAFDTDRYFVVSTNLLGGCRGTTGPSSIDPATAASRGIPSTSRNARWVRTMSPTVMTGKSAPKGSPVAGSMDDGPVVPRQPPSRFVDTTK